MAKKKGNRRNNGRSKITLLFALGNLGIVPDMEMSYNQLKRVVDMAYSFLPGGQIGDGVPNTYNEIIGSMLKAHGFVGNDAQEAMSLVWGSGKAVHYLDIPDFDPSSENTLEKKAAKAVGKDFFSIYKAIAKARKITGAEGRELEKQSNWRDSM